MRRSEASAATAGVVARGYRVGDSSRRGCARLMPTARGTMRRAFHNVVKRASHVAWRVVQIRWPTQRIRWRARTSDERLTGDGRRCLPLIIVYRDECCTTATLARCRAPSNREAHQVRPRRSPPPMTPCPQSPHFG